ncbi:MAG: ankyrin repeat domain-containing protein [Candidatus Eremiobacteraeota bacterium]|nr:ankyrin repeat domain-containing protein [Candidatus Eremiobacteraeota bacterium]
MPKGILIAVLLSLLLMFSSCSDNISQDHNPGEFNISPQKGSVGMKAGIDRKGGIKGKVPPDSKPPTPESKGDSDTVFKHVTAGDMKNLEKLISKNPSLIDKKDEDGDTPLHLAAEEGQMKIAELLMSKGAKINEKSRNKETPLHLAVEKGHLEMVRFLMKKGANINLKNEKGETPLEIATKTRRKRIAELLRSKGAK